jgi:hypothetical protein
MEHDASHEVRADGPTVVCRTCHAPVRKAATHLRVVFGQVQICHGPGGYVRIEVGAATPGTAAATPGTAAAAPGAGDGPSRRGRRRRRAA